MSASITVYIPSYNQKGFLIEAVDSVLAQTRLPDEIIIVDDASTDGPQELIRDYASRHPGLIRPILHDVNMGIAQTRNDAIDAAAGDYLSYVDGDDRWLPEKLEREYAALELHSADVAFSNHHNMTDAGVRMDTWVSDVFPPQGRVFEETFVRAYPRRDIFRMELVRTQMMRAIGAYDPELHVFEDYDMRIRLSKVAKTCYVNEPLSEIRRHERGLSASSRRDAVKTLKMIWAKNLPLLDDLPSQTCRRIRRGFHGWMGPIERDAAYESLYGERGSVFSKRLATLVHFSRCARYSPDRLSLGDAYRALLPDAWAKYLTNRAQG